MKIFKLSSLLFALFLLSISCSDDNNDPTPPDIDLGPYQRGIFVTNEGPFNNGTGSLSYISHDLSTIENDVYYKVNAQFLGNIVQSITFAEEEGFIVINGANEVIVVDRSTLRRNATITSGLSNPRYVAYSNDKLYVSNWGDPTDETDDYISTYDIVTLEQIGTISVGFGPERMVATTGNRIYIAHKGGWGQNNIVSVINTQSDIVGAEIEVGDVPGAIALDENEDVWVLSEGIPAWTGNETFGRLTLIDGSAGSVIATYDFPTQHPKNLCIAESNIYYTIDDGIYKSDIDNFSKSDTPDITGISAYHMDANNGFLYVLDAKDYSSLGVMSIYNGANLSKINDITVGVIPGGISFSN